MGRFGPMTEEEKERYRQFDLDRALRLKKGLEKRHKKYGHFKAETSVCPRCGESVYRGAHTCVVGT